MKGKPRKLAILELTTEAVEGIKPAGQITSRNINQLMGMEIAKADMCLEYYVKRGWLEFAERGRVGHTHGHSIKIYKMTSDGERELRRLRQRHG